MFKKRKPNDTLLCVDFKLFGILNKFAVRNLNTYGDFQIQIHKSVTIQWHFECLYLSAEEYADAILDVGDSTPQGFSNAVLMVGQTFSVGAKSICELGRLR